MGELNYTKELVANWDKLNDECDNIATLTELAKEENDSTLNAEIDQSTIKLNKHILSQKSFEVIY